MASASQPQNPANPSGGPGQPPRQGQEPRLSYQQRLEQLKAGVTELSRRNMDAALRVLRAWLKDGK